MSARRVHLSGERGQVIVFAVLGMALMMGFLALAADIGMLLHERRVMQTAADSAAIAGAAEIDNSGLTSAAQADAAQNGIPASAVTVNAGPANGPHKANAAYVEVIVSQAQPTLFMRFFLSSMTVGARAVATNVPDSHCLYTLGRSGAGINVTSGASLSMTGCGVLDDSSSSDAISIAAGGSLTAKSIGVVGSDSIGGGTMSPNPPAQIATVPNPLGGVPPLSITVGACNAAISYSDNSDHTVGGPPEAGGVICYRGFSNTGSGNITFPPGLYMFNGDFTNTGSGTISGTGVMIYMTGGGAFSNSGAGNLDLTAPASGTYSGILVYQDPNDKLTMNFTASPASNLSGIFYVPSAELSFTGSGGSYNAALVVKSLNVAGSVNLGNYLPPAGVSPLTMQRLVE